jgi:hypothetical protein
MQKRYRISILLPAFLFVFITIGISNADPIWTTVRYYDFSLCWPAPTRIGFDDPNGVSLCCNKEQTRCVICLRKKPCEIMTDEVKIRDSVIQSLINDYRTGLRLSETPPKPSRVPSSKLSPESAPTQAAPGKVATPVHRAFTPRMKVPTGNNVVE